MSKERLLASLSVSELEHLLRRAIDQCLDEPQPTSDDAAMLGRVAAEIRFELWLREQPVTPHHRRSILPAVGVRPH